MPRMHLPPHCQLASQPWKLPLLAATLTGLRAAQALYQLEVEVWVEGLGLSDRSSQQVGIRCIDSSIDPELKGHVFAVNDCRVRSPPPQPTGAVAHGLSPGPRAACWSGHI